MIVDDPLRINQRLKTSGQNYQPNQTRRIYWLLVAIPVLLIISFVFYMIASMDGALFGTPENEIESIIADKLQAYI